MKKKILYVHHSVGIGGAPKSLIEIIKSLPASEFEAEVLLLKRSDVCDLLDVESIKYTVADHWFYRRWYLPYAHIEVGWVKVFNPLKLFYFSVSWLISRFVGANLILKNHDADIIHLNSYALSDFLFAASRLAKTIIHVREPATCGHFGIRKRIIVNQIEKYADEVIAISKDNLARLDLNGRGHVIYNSFSPRSIVGRIPSSVPCSVIFLGGSSVHKGFLTLAAAADLINPAIKIIVLGYIDDETGRAAGVHGAVQSLIERFISPDREKVRNAVQKMKRLPNVEIAGVKKSIEEDIESSRLLLNLFTITHFSRPIIESYAMGRGVIATDVDGMEELVEVGETGFLVESRDSVALAETINRVVVDGDLLDRIGSRAKEVFLSRFSARNVRDVVAVYRKLSLGSGRENKSNA